MEHDKIQDMLSGTWARLVPLMVQGHVHKGDGSVLPPGYSASFRPIHQGDGKVLTLYRTLPGKLGTPPVVEISYGTADRYFSTVTDKSIRLSLIFTEYPRQYVMLDKANAKDNRVPYTRVPYPCSTEEYFQLMTVQNVLTLEQYKTLDDEVCLMQELLGEHGVTSVGYTLYNDILQPHEVNAMLDPYLRSSIV